MLNFLFLFISISFGQTTIPKCDLPKTPGCCEKICWKNQQIDCRTVRCAPDRCVCPGNTFLNPQTKKCVVTCPQKPKPQPKPIDCNYGFVKKLPYAFNVCLQEEILGYKQHYKYNCNKEGDKVIRQYFTTKNCSGKVFTHYELPNAKVMNCQSKKICQHVVVQNYTFAANQTKPACKGKDYTSIALLTNYCFNKRKLTCKKGENGKIIGSIKFFKTGKCSGSSRLLQTPKNGCYYSNSNRLLRINRLVSCHNPTKKASHSKVNSMMKKIANLKKDFNKKYGFQRHMFPSGHNKNSCQYGLIEGRPIVVGVCLREHILGTDQYFKYVCSKNNNNKIQREYYSAAGCKADSFFTSYEIEKSEAFNCNKNMTTGAKTKPCYYSVMRNYTVSRNESRCVSSTNEFTSFAIMNGFCFHGKKIYCQRKKVRGKWVVNGYVYKFDNEKCQRNNKTLKHIINPNGCIFNKKTNKLIAKIPFSACRGMPNVKKHKVNQWMKWFQSKMRGKKNK